MDDPLIVLYLIIALVGSLSVHEWAHAATAVYFGDPTPKYAGRLTLNPLAHLDPLGTLVLFVAHFGWGKPVPVNPNNLSNPRWQGLAISLAGPVSNFAIALLCALCFRVLPAEENLQTFLVIAIQMNIVLMVFNLIPIPPLDGSKVLLSLFPPRNAQDLINYLQYGPYLLFGILLLSYLTGQEILFRFIGPIIDAIYGVIMLQT